MINDLKNSKITVKENEPLSNYTFTETGGNADYVAFPKNLAELKELIKIAKDNSLPITTLGNASNLIIRDGGIRGLVIILTEMKTVEASGEFVTAEAGATTIGTTIVASDASLSGLEFAAGIPGSIGGAVYMNAGAYGGEMSEVVYSATVLMPNDEIQEFSNEDLEFSYRHSKIQENGGIIVSAKFKLKKGDKLEIKSKMKENNDMRASKQPLEFPSCGSVFKRPEGYYTGPLIIKAGLQGKIIGGVQISEKHAGFMVNINHGTATDYIDLIHLVQKTIKEKFDVNLETEVRIIGEEKKRKENK